MKCKLHIGQDFEAEAFEILKTKFDEVEWLSKIHKSPFDFKCVKDRKIYFGDAKLLNYNKKPSLSFSQKEADFVIAKINGKIEYIDKENFKEKVYMINKKQHIITIKNKTWEILTRDKINMGCKSFNEVISKYIKLATAMEIANKNQKETLNYKLANMGDEEIRNSK